MFNEEQLEANIARRQMCVVCEEIIQAAYHKMVTNNKLTGAFIILAKINSEYSAEWDELYNAVHNQ